MNRPRLLALIDCIAEWDVLVCFDSSRLARNGEDLGWIRNRLRSRGRRGVATSTGLDLENTGAKVMVVLNEEYLVKVRADTRRGRRGQVGQKLAAGGVPFGYRLEPHETEDGRRNSVIRIAPAEAAVVRRIFGRRADGAGLREIAHELNRAGIPSARGRGWAPSALVEMLRKLLYRGELVWNRSGWVKDHETGKRRRYERPESEWVRQRDEGWRIVSDDLWEGAQATARAANAELERDGRGRVRSVAGRRVPNTRHLLAGLVACGDCGGAFHSVKRPERWRCSWALDRGGHVCGSSLVVARTALESRVVGALRDRILTPENVAYAVHRAMEQIERVHQAAQEAPDAWAAPLRSRLEEIDAEARALAARIVRGEAAALDRQRLLIELRAEVQAELDAGAPAPRGLPERGWLLAQVEERTRELHQALEAEPTHGRRALTALLVRERIRVESDAEAGFRVSGAFIFPESGTAAPGQDLRRRSTVVAGERSGPSETPLIRLAA